MNASLVALWVSVIVVSGAVLGFLYITIDMMDASYLRGEDMTEERKGDLYGGFSAVYLFIVSSLMLEHLIETRYLAYSWFLQMAVTGCVLGWSSWELFKIYRRKEKQK